MFFWFFGVRATASFRKVSVEQSSGKPKREIGETLRIGAFNIAHGRGAVVGASNWGNEADRGERLERIGQLLRSHHLDLVILNEVDFDCSWSGRVDQASIIAREWGEGSIVRQRNYDTGLPFCSLAFGNAILSRFDVRAASPVLYPAVKWWEPLVFGRKDGVSTSLVQDEIDLKVVAVHLETRDQKVRCASLQTLLDRTEGSEILAGDFNATWSAGEESAIEMLRQDGRWQPAGGWEGDDAQKTFPALEPNRRIDWIFVPTSWKEVQVEVIPTELSDHALVISEWRVE